MKILALTISALILAVATTASATITTTTNAAATVTTTKKKVTVKHLHRKHAKKKVAPVDRGETVPYSEMRIGDPRIVYHEIGTSGAQNGNTIVPFYDEPIRSSKPYEIRYDYAEFGRD